MPKIAVGVTESADAHGHDRLLNLANEYLKLDRIFAWLAKHANLLISESNIQAPLLPVDCMDIDIAFDVSTDWLEVLHEYLGY